MLPLELPSLKAGTYRLIASKAFSQLSTCFLLASQLEASALKRALFTSCTDDIMQCDREEVELVWFGLSYI